MSDSRDNPEHLRKRAEEARAIAEALHDPEAKRTMLNIADTYDRLAQQAEDRAWVAKTAALAKP